MTRMMTSSETSNQDLAAIAAGHLFVSQVFFSPPNSNSVWGSTWKKEENLLMDMALYGWSLESTACFIGSCSTFGDCSFATA